jgi:hypothetical protein
MEIVRENCLEDGFTPEQVDRLEELVRDKPGDNFLCLVYTPKRPRLVCRTVAEALDTIRPGCWAREQG